MTLMKKSLGLAAILAATVSGTAMAQSVSAGVANDTAVLSGSGSDVSASGEVSNETAIKLQEGVITDKVAETVDVDGAQMLTDWTYAEVASSLKNKTALKADIGAINGATQVSTVGLTDLKEGDREVADAALDSAIEASYDDLTDMRAMISGNADLAAMIDANGYRADDVIGIYKTANGGFQVLVDNRLQ